MCATTSVFAQIPAVTGWVYNKKTLETIPGAIIVDSASYTFVESNAQGFYQFGTKQGDKTIINVQNIAHHSVNKQSHVFVLVH